MLISPYKRALFLLWISPCFKPEHWRGSGNISLAPPISRHCPHRSTWHWNWLCRQFEVVAQPRDWPAACGAGTSISFWWYANFTWIHLQRLPLPQNHPIPVYRQTDFQLISINHGLNIFIKELPQRNVDSVALLVFFPRHGSGGSSPRNMV